MSIEIKQGATDQQVEIRFLDITTGEPETGVAYNSAGIALWYRRNGGLKVAITPATLASLDAAHSDGGLLHISDGLCRLDLPDAAVASGAVTVLVGGSATGMVVQPAKVSLVANVEADTYARLGAPAGASTAADIAAVQSGVSNTYQAVTVDGVVLELDQSSVTIGTVQQAVTVGGMNANTVTASALAADAVTEIAAGVAAPSASTIAAAVWAAVAENSKTYAQLMRGMWSLLRGKSSGFVSGSSTAVFRDDADSKNRMTFTIDANGNKTAATVNSLD